MNSKWHVRTTIPGYKIREPIQSEFFVDENLDEAHEALVRETVQNSLDAVLNVEAPVRIRFRISDPATDLDSAKIAKWFSDLKPHVEGASEEELLRNLVDFDDDSCSFIAIEDFNTWGLKGNVAESEVDDAHLPVGERNWFYYFWRTEGRSPKRGEERGKWGIGKFVFPASSHACSFMGLTVRENDPAQYLMGQTVLCAHKVGNTRYLPDGDWGLNREGVVVPTSDDDVVAQFKSDFDLARVTEPGLSVVIPWHRFDELDGRGVCRQVIRNYMHSFVHHRLEVTTVDGTGEIHVTAGNLAARIQEVFDHDARPQVEQELLLLEDAETRHSADFVDVPHVQPADGRAKWEGVELDPQECLKLARQLDTEGEVLAFRVPILVQKKKQDPEEAFFHVLIQQVPDSGKSPTLFLRDGLRVSGERSVSPPADLYSAIVVPQGPLATLLSHCEGPAHMRWDQKRKAVASAEYKYVAGLLSFIRRSVSRLVGLVRGADEDPDYSTLAVFFPASDDEDARLPGKKKPVNPEPPKPPPPPRPKRFRMERRKAGFRISQAEAWNDGEAILTIRCAYDIARGNPFGKYRPEDFRLKRLLSDSEGVISMEWQDNALRCVVKGDSFSLAFDGFDPHRDLVVRALMKSAEDEAPLPAGD